jgi:hypothetical protein
MEDGGKFVSKMLASMTLIGCCGNGFVIGGRMR